MFVKVLRAKIHGATITQTDPAYVGSITIDEDLLRASGIRPNEVVLIADSNNGTRFETYVIKGEAGSGIIGVNGAAARLVTRGDKIIIFAHYLMGPEQLDDHEADVVVVDEHNRIAKQLKYPSSLNETIPS
ncbi:aspartate 1-decarboxylase [Planctomycetales bacterium ZRK34]|nr:aspartate 1-decarboxylase [Planctomycetales bacterium ZRK34]